MFMVEKSPSEVAKPLRKGERRWGEIGRKEELRGQRENHHHSMGNQAFQ